MRGFHTISTHSAAVHCGLKLHEIDATSTGPFALPLTHSLAPLTHSLAPLTHSLAPHCSLHSRRSAALICSLARSFTHSGAHENEVFVYGMNASISYSFKPLCAAAWHLCLTISISIFVSPVSWAAEQQLAFIGLFLPLVSLPPLSLVSIERG